MASPHMPVGIIHLVRKANGPEPFRTFVSSLRAAPPTGDWRLVLICKGFAAGAVELATVDDLPVQAIDIPDTGLDISAYFDAASMTDADPLIFFNSFSRLVEPHWFEHFTTALAAPGVGLVGATGSLESFVRNHRIYARAASGLAKAKFHAIAAGLLPWFPAFPNPHVRTNAFAIRRADFLATKTIGVDRKLGAWCYESGRHSLTRQILARGLRAVVVDRDGAVLSPDAWADARVFRSGDQERVLVEDNRVREYAAASRERKAMLRYLAFGV